MTPKGIPPALDLPAARVESLLVTAGRAPSLHNSQPWRFEVRPSAIELHAERDRALPVIDPTGRAMRIACGAALFNLRLALHGNGIRPLVTILPDDHRGDLVAVIRHGGHKAATPDLRALLDVVSSRHTDRYPTEGGTPGATEMNALRRAAVAEGAWMHVIDDRAQQALVQERAVEAHEQRMADAAFRAEIERWTTTGPERDDGVPAALGGPLAAPVLATPAPADGVPARAVDSVAVLVGQATGDRGDVQVGQALQRVLLTATAWELGVSFVPHVVQVHRTREELRWMIGGSRPPQVVLRVRRGLPSVGTARRSAADLVAPART